MRVPPPLQKRPKLTTFRVVDSYLALPGKCIACGSARTPLLDTGISIDFYGAVVFCIECAKEAARAIGYSEPPVAEEVTESPLTQEEINDHHVSISAAIDMLSDVRDRFYSLSNFVEDPESETSESATDNRTSKQDGGQDADAIVSERSPSVPISTSDVPTFGLL